MKSIGYALLFVVFVCSKVTAQAPSITYQTPQVYTVNTPVTSLSPKNTGGAVPANRYGEISTIAGMNMPGDVDGNHLVAQFNAPRGIACDKNGNIYVADRSNNKIRKVTPAGMVSTVAGSGTAGSDNLSGASATFTGPNGLVVAQDGTIYVADSGNALIRKIATNGSVSTYAGSLLPGNEDGKQFASFDFPNDLVIDNAGKLYVSDYANQEMRSINTDGTVHTVAGALVIGFKDGTGPAARFYNPGSVAMDNSGNIIICDANNNAIRKMTPDSVVTTIAGNGTKGFADGDAATAMFSYLGGVAVDNLGNIYIADTFNYLIRKLDPTGKVSTICGMQGLPGSKDGVRETASVAEVFGLATDNNGNLFIADGGNNSIRKLSLTGYEIDKPLPPGLTFDETNGTISGTPSAASPSTNYTITAYNLSGSSSTVLNITVKENAAVNTQAPDISYQTPQVYNIGNTIPALMPKNTGGAVPPNTYAQVTTFAGSGALGQMDGSGINASFSHPIRSAEDANGNLYVADRDNDAIRKITPTGTVSTYATGISQPNGVAIAPNGDIYVTAAASNAVELVKTDGSVQVFAGGNQGYSEGTGTNAAFYYPYGITIDNAGNLYVADSQNSVIRKVTTPGAVVSTLAGSGNAAFANGTGNQASFNKVDNVFFDASGILYAGDTFNNRIREITLAGTASTIAGTGATGNQDGPAATATFSSPGTTATDAAGNVYIADAGNYEIRKIDKNGIVSTLAGSGSFGSADGIGKNASFGNFYGLNVDPTGIMYVTDLGNSKIRKISLTGYTIDKPLPPGLTFDPTTGIITGTPIAASPSTNYTITAYNLSGNSSTVLNITVNGTKPVVVPPPNISYQTPQVYTLNTLITPLVPTNTGGAVPPNNYGQVSTYATGFVTPFGLTFDTQNNLFVANANGATIKKVTPNGTVSTFAGSGTAGYMDGTGIKAEFKNPADIKINGNGDFYISDSNELIRKATPGAAVTTFAGTGTPGFANGPAQDARFSQPRGLAIDAAGNLYIADSDNNMIREISIDGTVSTFAGAGTGGAKDGPALTATFNDPAGMAFDHAGNLLIADEANNKIRKIDINGNVSTIAGNGTLTNTDADGQALNAGISSVIGVVVDPSNNIFIANESAVRRIKPDGTISTFAGSLTSNGLVNGDRLAARFFNIFGLAYDNNGDLYVSDAVNGVIRKIITTGYDIEPDLPPGLNFDHTTGVISGTPTAVSPATNYTITAYNAGGSSSAVVNIQVIQALTAVTIGSIYNKSICAADFAPDISGGTGIYTVTSSNTNVATILDGKIHIVGAGITIISATDGNTTATTELDVLAPDTQTVTITPPATVACEGDMLTYTAVLAYVPTGITPSYQWYVNGQQAGADQNTYQSNTLKNGDVIKCIVTNASDCSPPPISSPDLVVSINPVVTPGVSIQALPTGPVAAGTPIVFTATPANGGSNPLYQWQVNNINVGTNSATYSNSCLNSGDVVTCSLINQDSKCVVNPDATSNSISVNIATVDQNFTISTPITAIYEGEPVTFTATATDPGSSAVYQWKVNNQDAGGNSATFTTHLLKNGDMVTCTLTTSSCGVPVTSNEITITLLPIIIPTAFTPNNDGINDQWNIAPLVHYPNCLVDVFTRYGAMIFHSRGYTLPWDGTFKGSKLANGTYYYVIDLGDGSPKLSGYVALIR